MDAQQGHQSSSFCGSVNLDLAVCIIPAFNPGPQLPVLVRELSRLGMRQLIVVNDGSNGASLEIFDSLPDTPNVFRIDHAVNLGKGAALKTGLNHAYCAAPQAAIFVTADADGQHDPQDIISVAREALANPGALLLGARTLNDDVPLRSRFGNTVTRWMVHWVLGSKLEDTQTGLRAIPRSLVPVLLRIGATGYEFELDMLIAAKHLAIPIREAPIRTIYLDNNRSSHFNPLLDSMRIYFVLMRFSAVSLLTAVLDNLIFIGAYKVTADLLTSQIIGRLGAVAFNYQASKKAVFLSRLGHHQTLGKYLALVAVNAGLSYALINFMIMAFGIEVLSAKIIAESLLFFVNFTIQRDYIFTRPMEGSSR